MSHFAVLVIGPNPDDQMAPYHEFECTGEDDQYVQDIDITDEARQLYEKDETVRRLKLTDGTLVDPYGDDGNYKPEFLRRPTDVEAAQIKAAGPLGLGLGSDVSFQTVGYGDETRVVHFPAGAEDIRVPAKESLSFIEWLEHYYGYGADRAVKMGEQPDTEGVCKYGYYIVNERAVNGERALRVRDEDVATLTPTEVEVVKVIDRTNPNKKWDYYRLGGRWHGYFRLKPDAKGLLSDPPWEAKFNPDGFVKEEGVIFADQAYKGDIDFAQMREHDAREAGERWDRIHLVLDQHPPLITWDEMRKQFSDEDIKQAREMYWSQAGIVACRDAHVEVFDFDDSACPRDVYVKRAENDAAIPFAIVHDGHWIERGEMGWWGIVTDQKPVDEWLAQARALIDSLPDDTLFTCYDCHI